MADVDPKLVQAIAAQVIAVLRRSDAPEGVTKPVDVHAPIGICTGDYSKFPELRATSVGAPPEGHPQNRLAPLDGTAELPPIAKSAAPASAPGSVMALKGVITVAQLRTMKGSILLAKGAILSPLAQDYVRDKHISVMTDEGALAVRVNAGTNPVGNGQTFWWIEGQCPSVAKVVELLRPNVLASREPGSAANLRNVVKELAGLVKHKRVSGGLLFVASAARAVCFANRCASLRAIVGTSDKSVSEGIEFLGANVLVIEYPMHGFASMSAMVKSFVESLQVAPAAVQKELDELRMCV